MGQIGVSRRGEKAQGEVKIWGKKIVDIKNNNNNNNNNFNINNNKLLYNKYIKNLNNKHLIEIHRNNELSKKVIKILPDIIETADAQNNKHDVKLPKTPKNSIMNENDVNYSEMNLSCRTTFRDKLTNIIRKIEKFIPMERDIINIRGDGSCAYRAILRSLGEPEEVMSLRNQIANRIQQKGVAEDIYLARGCRSLEDYTNKIRNSSFYADEH